jgi:hypothetical protein
MSLVVDWAKDGEERAQRSALPVGNPFLPRNVLLNFYDTLLPRELDAGLALEYFRIKHGRVATIVREELTWNSAARILDHDNWEALQAALSPQAEPKVWVFQPVRLEDGDDAHANALLFHLPTNRVYLFEPHGYAIGGYFEYDQFTTKVGRRLRTLMSGFTTDTFNPLVVTNPGINPQDREVNQFTDADGATRNYEGTCTNWAAYFVDFMLSTSPDKPVEEAINQFIELEIFLQDSGPNGVYNFIESYTNTLFDFVRGAAMMTNALIPERRKQTYIGDPDLYTDSALFNALEIFFQKMPTIEVADRA